jgi:hypothetical protein
LGVVPLEAVNNVADLLRPFLGVFAVHGGRLWLGSGLGCRSKNRYSGLQLEPFQNRDGGALISARFVWCPDRKWLVQAGHLVSPGHVNARSGNARHGTRCNVIDNGLLNLQSETTSCWQLSVWRPYMLNYEPKPHDWDYSSQFLGFEIFIFKAVSTS